MDWIHLAQCRAHLRNHVNMIMNLRTKNLNLRIILESFLCHRVDWIHLAQCRAHLRTHVNMIINLRSKNFDLRIKLRVNFVSDSGLDSFGAV